MFDMAASPCIQCRVDPQLKLRLQAIAVERGLTESAVPVAGRSLAASGDPPTHPILSARVARAAQRSGKSRVHRAELCGHGTVLY